MEDPLVRLCLQQEGGGSACCPQASKHSQVCPRSTCQGHSWGAAHTLGSLEQLPKWP